LDERYLQAGKSAHVEPGSTRGLNQSHERIKARSTSDDQSGFERIEMPFAERGDLTAGGASSGGRRHVHREKLAELAGRSVSI
jgi:hypothetical protein